MQSSERSWSDRNGTDHEWGGGSGPGSSILGTSPRKDFGRGFDSWRRQGRNAVNSEQDDDAAGTGGWRASTTKWTGRTGGSSWRSDSDPGKDAGGWSVARGGGSWGDDRGAHPHPHVHRPWDPPHAHAHPAAHGADGDSVSGPLPEWATETPTESRGSFDASGAFHGGTPLSDDEFSAPQDGGGAHGSAVARVQRQSALTGDPGKRAGSPLAQRDVVPPGVTRSASQNGVGDLVDRHVRPVQEVTESASTGSDSPRSVTSRSTDRSGTAAKDVESHRSAAEKQMTAPAPAVAPPDRDRDRERERESSSSRPDEEMERMREVADDLVAKLMEDEDHRTGVPPPATAPPGGDKWFYRDPQGDVQGPFSSSEMLDWFRSGYFNLTLLVRRACDERYSSLGDIIKLWGRLPFVPGGPPVPPIKADAIPSVAVPPLVPAAPPPTSDLLSDGHGHSLLMQQYQYQYTMLQRQLLLGQQAAVHAAAQAAIGELSQSDRWASLSPLEQRRLVTERLALQQMLGVPPLVAPPSVVDLFSVAAPPPGPQPAPPPPAAQPQPVSAGNPVAQLISQMQMGAVAAAVGPKEHQPPALAPPPPAHSLVDPLQQLLRQMGGGLPSAPAVPPPGGQPLGGGVGLDSDGPGRTLLQTLNAGKPPAVPPVDSVWGGSVPAGYSLGVGAAAPWMAPAPPASPAPAPAPPGQLPSLPLSLWDLAQQQGKDAKAEHQGLEGQLRVGEERRLEEQRRREENEEAMRKHKELLEKEEEEKRKLKEKEEEEKKKKKKQEEEEEKKKRKQQEEEDKKKKKQQEEEEKKRKKQQEEEEKKRKKQQEEEEKKRKKEEERRLREQEEEERRREEAERQLREEEERERRRKQQEAKKIEEAMKKEKEKAAQKREEEKKRKEAEKEKKKKAEEAKKKEEEEKKKQEEEERTRQRRQEQQEKALRKLQEQQEKARQAAALRPAPWAPAPPPQQPLTEIQRQERERERQQQILQQQQQQQQLQQQQQANANAAAQNSAGAQTGNGSVIGGLQLRWAEVKPPVPVAKSLTEIQQEEQENLAKQQLERERQQQQQQQQQAAAAPAVATASIWGAAAAPSLAWAASPWGSTAASAGSGFWEDAAKTSTAVPASKSRSATNHNNNIINNNSSSGNNKNSGNGANSSQPWKNLPANTKTRSKKEEAVVMKLFEPRPDEFTQWCTDALGSLKHSIDVPTFVAFLRDIESAYEVKDYVRVYLGEGRDAQEFSRQFLERRGKLQQKAARDDDHGTPAPASAPSRGEDFHEVKGKGKKAKKSRMYKVDSRILGFNVTAARDRLNVGERDFGDGM